MLPSSAIRFAGTAIVAGMALVPLAGLLSGRINMRGLFTVKGGADDGALSPARVQLFITTIAAAGAYALQVLSSGTLPDVPAQWLAVFGASHLLYLGGKAWSVFRRASGT